MDLKDTLEFAKSVGVWQTVVLLVAFALVGLVVLMLVFAPLFRKLALAGVEYLHAKKEVAPLEAEAAKKLAEAVSTMGSAVKDNTSELSELKAGQPRICKLPDGFRCYYQDYQDKGKNHAS